MPLVNPFFTLSLLYGFFSSSTSSPSDFQPSASSGTGSSSSSPQLSDRRHTTRMYNSDVASVEQVSRPIRGSVGTLGFSHSGVVATTKGGDSFLVHKGKDYGDTLSKIYFCNLIIICRCVLYFICYCLYNIYSRPVALKHPLTRRDVQ